MNKSNPERVYWTWAPRHETNPGQPPPETEPSPQSFDATGSMLNAKLRILAVVSERNLLRTANLDKSQVDPKAVDDFVERAIELRQADAIEIVMSFDGHKTIMELGLGFRADGDAPNRKKNE